MWDICKDCSVCFLRETGIYGFLTQQNNCHKSFTLLRNSNLKLQKYSQMVSSHNRFELSLLTELLATQRYQPVWLRLMSVTLMMLELPCAKTEKLPLRVSCFHAYWMGSVPFSRLQRIHIVDPSTGDASLIKRYGLLTGTVAGSETHTVAFLLAPKSSYTMFWDCVWNSTLTHPISNIQWVNLIDADG